ncbi:MAG: hypothetical protein D6722_14765, partial [Bacteroidetes bacterium]
SQIFSQIMVPASREVWRAKRGIFQRRDSEKDAAITHHWEFDRALGYGHMVVDSASLDLFWLEGPSQISPQEQVDFLHRFYHRRLPISARTDSLLRRMMVIEATEEYVLSGKTGWAIRGEAHHGWLVGYRERGEDVLFFATLIRPAAGFDMDRFAAIRGQLTRQALAWYDAETAPDRGQP